jgi:legume-like lectin family protein/IPT/TIG domain-containing protein
MKSMGTITALLAILLASPLFAQINKPDFSSVADMVLQGSATQFGNELRITDTVSNQTGWAWYQSQQFVVSGFDTTFQFRITPGPTLAEGFAFVVQNAASGTSAIASQPWTLGYGGMPNSIAVEFDTFQDGFLNDTSNNELTVHTRGTIANNENENFSIGRITPGTNMSNSMPHTMRVRYVPGLLEVFIDDLVNPLLAINYDFSTGANYIGAGSAGGLSLPNGMAWVGFSGSTGAGGLTERVEILDWTFNSSSPLDACFDGNVPDGLGGIENPLLVNGSHGGLFRKVTLNSFEPLSVEMLSPTTAGTTPMPFGILGLIGEADGSLPGVTPFGSICFPVHALTPSPATFTFTENFGIGAPALLPSTPTPWIWSQPTGLPFATTFTLQGFVQTDPTNINSIEPTNAVIVEVVAAPAPVINSVSPATGTPGTAMTISGADFSTNLSVTVDGLLVSPLSVSPTAIVIPEPVATGCDLPLVITNADGQTATASFNASPIVTNTINAQGSASGGGLFVIQGMNFAPGTTVTIGGNPAMVTTTLSNTIVCTPPAGTTGTATVLITTPTNCSTTTTYTYL